MIEDGPPEFVAAQIGALLASGKTPEELAKLGVQIAIIDRIDHIRRSSTVRARMEVARRAGLPYSEVLDRWNDDDLAMEVALDAVKAEDHERHCPNCGIDPSTVLDLSDPDDVQQLENGYWKLRQTGCFTCQQIAWLSREFLDDDERRDGVRWELARRSPGEPWIEWPEQVKD